MYADDNNGKAFFYSILVYMSIAGLCFFGFLTMPYTHEQVNQGGIEVNFGTSEKGMGSDYTNTENPAVSPRPNHRINTSQVHTTTASATGAREQTELVTQNNEEAAALNSRKKAARVSKSGDQNGRKPEKINSNALYKGAVAAGTGGGDGNTGEPGNQGKVNGSVLSHSYTGTGIGGGGIALNLEGRKFLSRPELSDDGQSEGRITVQITVNREGNITNAKAGGRGTTIQNASLWRKCEEAAKQAKLNSIADGPEIQTGLVIFSFKLQ